MSAPTLVVRLDANDVGYWGRDCNKAASQACNLPVLAAQWSHPKDKWDGRSWPRPNLTDAERDTVRDATALTTYGHALPAELVAALLAIIARTTGQ